MKKNIITLYDKSSPEFVSGELFLHITIEDAQKRSTLIQKKLRTVDKMDADEAEALLNSGE